MAAFLLRLMVLLSVALMPMGMSAAAAAPAAHHAAASHCDPQQDEAPAMPVESDCLACAGLPVVIAPMPADRLIPAMPRLLRLSHEFLGIEPETSTPPPKRA